MRRFVTLGPSLVVLLTLAVTLLAAPAAVRLVRTADAMARVRAARVALAEDDILGRLSRAVSNVAEAVVPSVVHLDVRTEDRDGSLGSGWVYDERGYIVTNAHVVAGARSITVQFSDGRLYDGALVGIDPGTDVAVVRIDPVEPLVALPRSDAPLRVGERVFSFGSPFNFKFSMSEGIVSGLGRESTTYANIGAFSNFIQFDAAVNPGNSGGPVVDVLGRAIGMNVAIANNTNSLMTSQQGQSAGISFAIPVRVVEFVAGQLIESGQVRRGFLGIVLPRRDGPEYLRNQVGYVGLGVHVDGVVADGPAERSGLRTNDVIVGIDGEQITGVEMLRSVISTMAPGQDTEIEFWRAGSTDRIRVRVAEFERPAQVRQNVNATLRSLGIALDRPQDAEAQPLLGFVLPGSAAYLAGLESGMIVASVNGTPVRTVQELCDRLDGAGFRIAGASVRIGVDLEEEPGTIRRREFTLRIPR